MNTTTIIKIGEYMSTNILILLMFIIHLILTVYIYYLLKRDIFKDFDNTGEKITLFGLSAIISLFIILYIGFVLILIVGI